MTSRELEWVAHLARLDCSPAELERLAGQLTQIMAYIDQLQAVDTAGVEPMAHPAPLSNVFRADTPTDSLPVEAALANAPARRGDFYAVPAVLDRG